MNYLFFDLECSNCYKGNGKICEFGYVLADEYFNVIKHFDFPICPGKHRSDDAKFDLSIFKREPGFEWAYSFDEYFSSPLFPYYYELIKKLLENPNNMILGWAIENDINYLKYTTNKYGLEPYRFKAIDIKVFVDKYKRDNPSVEFKKLSGAFKHFASSNEFIRLHSHKAEDDAYMSMRILQELCKKTNKTLKQLIEENPSSVKETNKAPSDEKRIKELWNEACSLYVDKIDDKEFVGKRINISSMFKKDLKLFNEVISIIKERGYIPVNKIMNSDYMLTYDNADKERLLRAFKYPYNGKLVTIDELKTNK